VMMVLKVQMNAPPESGYWNILLNYLQTLIMVLSASSWYTNQGSSNHFVQKISGYLSAFNIHMLGVECAAQNATNPVIKFLWLMISPLFLILILVTIICANFLLTKWMPKIMGCIKAISLTNIVGFVLSISRKTKSEHSGYELLQYSKNNNEEKLECYKDLLPTVLNGILLLFKWSYFSLSVEIFQVLQPCSAENYMKNFPWVFCSGGTYVTLQFIAYSFFIIYVIGIPMLLLGLVLNAQKKNKLRDKFTRKVMGFLYICYKKQNPGPFMMFFARRVILSGIFAMVDEPWTNIGIIGVLLAFQCLHTVMYPFRKDRENILQSLEVLVLVFTFVTIQTVSFNLLVGALLFFLNAAMTLTLVVHFIQYKLEKAKNNKKRTGSVAENYRYSSNASKVHIIYGVNGELGGAAAEGKGV